MSEALGLPQHVMLHFSGVAARLMNAVHNLPGDLRLADLVNDSRVVDALASPIPRFLEDGLEPYVSGPCIVVAGRYATTGCVMILGGRAELTQDESVILSGAAVMAANGAATALRNMIAPDCPLSERELQCLSAVAAGVGYKEVGRELGISPRTVEKHVERCRQRLGVPTSLAATLAAVRAGWISDAELEVIELRSRRRQCGADQRLRG
jgi:DNA-binding CsgD family transcriptional regulator